MINSIPENAEITEKEVLIRLLVRLRRWQANDEWKSHAMLVRMLVIKLLHA